MYGYSRGAVCCRPSARCAWVWCFPPKCIALLSNYWSPACPHESSEKWRWTAGVDGLEFV